MAGMASNKLYEDGSVIHVANEESALGTVGESPMSQYNGSPNKLEELPENASVEGEEAGARDVAAREESKLTTNDGRQSG